MNRLPYSAVLPLFLCLAITAQGAAPGQSPVIPGLHHKHPLDQAQIGQLLIQELNCTACHALDKSALEKEASIKAKTAPDLTNVGWRVAPEYLEQFITAPSRVHSGNTMPDLFSSEPEQRRTEIAQAITHFLVARSDQPFQRKPSTEKDITVGQELFHMVGCIACHSPRDAEGKESKQKGVVSLSHLPEKYGLESLSNFLFQPTNIRSSGRMPDMKLTKAEAHSIASYLVGSQESREVPFKFRPDFVEQGRKYFEEFNCTACHALEGMPEGKPSLALLQLNPGRGCLSDAPGGAPDYNLDGEQKKAIRKALAAASRPLTNPASVALTMTAYNCIACHVRDDYGGVDPELDQLFTTSNQTLGNEARIPPPLTGVGAKLRLEWTQKVLFDGESVRHYMKTRMPLLSEANLGYLPELLARVDTIKQTEMPEPGQEEEKEWRKAGHELVGDKALNCIACHNFNGKKTPGLQGMDLMTSYQRLQPSWFYQYLLNPLGFRPGIIMPSYWPDGEAVQTEILDGNTDAQIKAIWHYLSLGRSAPDPSGMHSPGTRLEVVDTPRLYRGRSSIAGFRGIAVGFPGGANYAFNAEMGTLTGFWKGDYVTVRWGGQGAGGFNPAARAISLAQDVAFFRLASENDPWPLRPRMTKEQPINPDPLYPRKHGYAFKGYYFDDDSVPVLMYRTGKIEIEDRTIAVATGEKPRFKRTFYFISPERETLYFRALTGKIERVSDNYFKTPSLGVRTHGLLAVVRPLKENTEEQELLLNLTVLQGESTVSIDYEILR